MLCVKKPLICLMASFMLISARETLFVFGGLGNSGRLDNVEALSLSSSNLVCPSISSLPNIAVYITAATIDGSPVLCGGADK